MALIAVFSPKGGVGKTTLAVNLAAAAATRSARRTLLWDLDAQGAASFVLAPDRAGRDEARAVLAREVAPEQLIVPTAVDRLDLLPADASLRAPDLLFAGLDAKKRLRRIGELLADRYDRVVVDCPPGLGLTAEQVVRAADLLVMPTTPSVLGLRMADELSGQLRTRGKAGPRMLPVFNLVDRRRASHREALAAAPDQPAIPMATALERMADMHAPLAAYAPRSAAAAAIGELWVRVERLLAGGR